MKKSIWPGNTLTKRNDCTGLHSRFALPSLSCWPSVLYVLNLDFEVVGFLPFYARKLAKHNKRLVGRQMIKLLSRPTNNVEPFCGKRKVANLSADTSQNLRWFA